MEPKMLILKAAILRTIVVAVGILLVPAVIIGRTLRFLLNPSKFFYIKRRTKPPACVDDPKYGTHFLARVNGVTLHCVANGRKGAELMLLVHGFPELWWSWRHQLTAFSDDYYVVAFDLRGYGDSSKPQGKKNYEMANLVDDIHELIGHLGYEKAIVVSHDWGAAISWQFAYQYPESVSKLVVMDNPPNLLRLRSMLRSPLAITTWYNFFFQIPCLPELALRACDINIVEYLLLSNLTGVVNKKMITEEDLEVFKYFFSRDGAWNYPVNYYRGRWSFVSLLSSLKELEMASAVKWQVKPKTLILWGSEDRMLSCKVAFEAQSYCADAVVKIVKNASHWVQQDNPDQVNAEIRAFLNS